MPEAQNRWWDREPKSAGLDVSQPAASQCRSSLILLGLTEPPPPGKRDTEAGTSATALPLKSSSVFL